MSVFVTSKLRPASIKHNLIPIFSSWHSEQKHKGVVEIREIGERRNGVLRPDLPEEKPSQDAPDKIKKEGEGSDIYDSW